MRRGRRLQYLGSMSNSAALETYYKRGESEWKEMFCTTLAVCTGDTILICASASLNMCNETCSAPLHFVTTCSTI